MALVLGGFFATGLAYLGYRTTRRLLFTEEDLVKARDALKPLTVMKPAEEDLIKARESLKPVVVQPQPNKDFRIGLEQALKSQIPKLRPVEPTNTKSYESLKFLICEKLENLRPVGYQGSKYEPTESTFLQLLRKHVHRTVSN